MTTERRTGNLTFLNSLESWSIFLGMKIDKKTCFCTKAFALAQMTSSNAEGARTTPSYEA